MPNDGAKPLTLSATDSLAMSVVEAIQRGDVHQLRNHLGINPELARARIVDEKQVARTLLHIVTDWPGHFPNGAESVAVLVSAGADVNAALTQEGPGGSPETPLHWAASTDDLAVLDALLDGGADIEVPGAVFTGGPPMSDAVVFAQWNAANRLLERGANTTMWQAAALGLLGDVKQYVIAQPPPTPDEITNALWHACRGGQLPVVQYLCEQGANLKWIGYDQKTPLDVARESGNAELGQWLDAWTFPSESKND